MCRRELPRVFELMDLVEDRTSPNAYLQNFERDFCVQVWLAREAELEKLDKEAWDFLKNEARPYLTERDPKRGWEQLISTLNQARAYGYLQTIGCSTPHFIHRGKNKTPDLEGDLNGCKVLCEVKTINISDEEATGRHENRLRETNNRLEEGFFNKLKSDLEEAKKQMNAYEGREDARRIAFVIINFDDLLAQYREEYYRQIDEYLAENSLPGVEVVFYNQKTALHSHVTMTHATVINE